MWFQFAQIVPISAEKSKPCVIYKNFCDACGVTVPGAIRKSWVSRRGNDLFLQVLNQAGYPLRKLARSK